MLEKRLDGMRNKQDMISSKLHREKKELKCASESKQIRLEEQNLARTYSINNRCIKYIN